MKYKVGDIVWCISLEREVKIIKVTTDNSNNNYYKIKYFMHGMSYYSHIWDYDDDLEPKDVKDKLKMEKYDFQIGDFVRIRGGTAKRIITDFNPSGMRIYTKYVNEELNKRYPGSCRMEYKSQFVHWTDEDEAKEKLKTKCQTTKETDMTNKLYQVNGKDDQFGTFLTKNSKGQFVLEMKGSGDVKAFDSKDLTEVKPNYVWFTNLVDKTDYSIECSKDVFKVGDIFIIDGFNGIYAVRNVEKDTPTSNNINNDKKIRRLDPKVFKEVKFD